MGIIEEEDRPLKSGRAVAVSGASGASPVLDWLWASLLVKKAAE